MDETAVNNTASTQPVQPAYTTAAVEDKLDTGMQVLIFFGNFCITPILGLVLYLVWKDQKPQSAKKVCNLTLISFGLQLLLTLCYVLFVFVIIGASSAAK